MEMLIAHGCNLESKTKSGATALMKAAFKGHADIVELLICEGAAIDAAAESGFNAIITGSQVHSQVLDDFSPKIDIRITFHRMDGWKLLTFWSIMVLK